MDIETENFVAGIPLRFFVKNLLEELVMSTRRVAIVTLGCEKNLVDTEVMAGLIEKKGYEMTTNPELADVVIVNTCAFIDAAKQESVDTILEMASSKGWKSGKKLLVAGCMAQRYAEELLEEIPEIDGVVGTGEFPQIAEVIERVEAGERPKFVGNPVYIYDERTPRKLPEQLASAYVKIAEGCDHQCTFCVIPNLRGRFRSRALESIVSEVTDLARRGVKEVNLIAQDTTQYGYDLYGKRELPELLRALNEVEGIEWIRLHYAYPGYFTDDLISAFQKLPKVVKYIDLPLQHSEDHILRSMQRPGHQTQIRKLLAKIREQVPNVALRTSLIVGFPGENEEDFARLKQFVQEVEFDHVGVFTYSAEAEATSANFPQQVDTDVKERRANELMEVARVVAAKRLERHVGQVVPVLIEAQEDDGFVGRTPYDAKEIDGVVTVVGSDLQIGSIVPVRITHTLEFDLVGEVL